MVKMFYFDFLKMEAPMARSSLKIFQAALLLIRREAKPGNFTARNFRDQHCRPVSVRRVQQNVAKHPDPRWAQLINLLLCQQNTKKID